MERCLPFRRSALRALTTLLHDDVDLRFEIGALVGGDGRHTLLEDEKATLILHVPNLLQQQRVQGALGKMPNQGTRTSTSVGVRSAPYETIVSTMSRHSGSPQ